MKRKLIYVEKHLVDEMKTKKFNVNS